MQSVCDRPSIPFCILVEGKKSQFKFLSWLILVLVYFQVLFSHCQLNSNYNTLSGWPLHFTLLSCVSFAVSTITMQCVFPFCLTMKMNHYKCLWTTLGGPFSPRLCKLLLHDYIQTKSNVIVIVIVIEYEFVKLPMSRKVLPLMNNFVLDLVW